MKPNRCNNPRCKICGVPVRAIKRKGLLCRLFPWRSKYLALQAECDRLKAEYNKLRKDYEELASHYTDAEEDLRRLRKAIANVIVSLETANRHDQS